LNQLPNTTSRGTTVGSDKQSTDHAGLSATEFIR